MRAVSFTAIGLCLILFGTQQSLGGRKKAPVGPGLRGCLVHGTWKAVGDTWLSKDGCVNCSCILPGPVPVCLSYGCTTTQSSTATVFTRPAGCLENEVWYAVGATFKRKCNTCTCTAPGIASCTKIYCGAGCLVGDVWHAAGASFYIDCNKCACFRSGYPVCTRIACGEGCLSEDVWYTVGATFKKDCNTCTCSSHRNIICTEMYCGQVFLLG